MTYTHTRFPNRPKQLPLPPQYLAWMDTYNHGQGTVRHAFDLARAKRYIREYAVPYGGYGQFTCDWTVYKFENDEWRKLHEGKRGDNVKDNSLMQTVIRKQGVDLPDVDDEELAAALESIAKAGS